MDPSTRRGAPSHPQSRIHDINEEPLQQRVRFAEGEPQASYRIYQPTARPEGQPAATSSAPYPPSVYWDDRDNASQLTADNPPAGYTFYREGTPPPPDDEGSEKRLGYGPGLAAHVGEGSTVGGGTASSDREFNFGPRSEGGNGNGNWNWSVGGSDKTSPTAKKKLLWAIIVAGVLILIGVAVGVGVGLGVGLKSKGSAEPIGGAASSPPASDLNSGPTPTNPPSATAQGTEGALATTTGSAENQRPTYNSDCPALNNTIYHVPGSTRSFKRFCGVDYGGDGATDLTQAWTESMADCMNTCASFNECTACAWGYLEGDKGSKHRCYMKKDLKKAHTAASDWCFAILQ
ncbi:hypothetical protein VTI74DRAFT_3478 [Chaetomium olivicolor]